MSWKLEIKKINNGYVLKIPNEQDQVIEERFPDSDDEYNKGLDEEQYTMKQLLEKVAEYFGMQYDKFELNNLNITFDLHGHKV